jgi:hypothetical protein
LVAHCRCAARLPGSAEIIEKHLDQVMCTSTM